VRLDWATTGDGWSVFHFYKTFHIFLRLFNIHMSYGIHVDKLYDFYNFRNVKSLKIHDFFSQTASATAPPPPDVHFTLAKPTLLQLIQGGLSPMSAYRKFLLIF
jgi:hypothetical protein